MIMHMILTVCNNACICSIDAYQSADDFVRTKNINSIVYISWD